MPRKLHRTIPEGETEMKRHWPATFIALPPSCEGRRAAFYLAAEEYIAEHLPEGNYFFTWQIGPTVVMGRNQVAHQEIDLDFCRKEGIDVIRRRSGGGAIFADERNIMTSLITEDAPVESLFQEYAEAVAEALRQLGAPAQVTGRNDIVVRSEKVCGNAFYKKVNRCIAHGTMLYDTDPRLMEGALHPTAAKLKSKGVKSVRSRVGLLKDCLSFGVEELRKQLRTLLCDKAVELGEEDIRKIEKMEQAYYEPQYLLGNTGRADIVKSSRIEGCGQVEVHLRLQGSIISEVTLRGDFFETGNAEQAFAETFTGRTFTPESLAETVSTHHPESTVRNLTPDALLKLLTE